MAVDLDDESTQVAPGTPAGSLVVMVYGEHGTASHVLPAGGHVLLGRDRAADIRLDDPHVSRRHAVLHNGPAVELEDLGSVNGTRVRGQPVEPRGRIEIAIGDPIQIGGQVLVVARAREPARASLQPIDVELVRSPVMQAVYQLAGKAAASEVSVLILGETGVGKDVLAQFVHRASARAAGPFLRLNCAALTETLLESELFGHERGAFTGATTAKPGLLETAAGGTVFLDEVGELPLTIQAKLLQVIETRVVTRVGGLTARPIDVRFVSATNRELARLVEQGQFRADLFYRLDGVAVTVPPLRDRVEEVASLAEHFLAVGAHVVPPPRLSDAAVAALEVHSWPGNVRELRNVIGRAALLCDGDLIEAEHLHLDRGHRHYQSAPTIEHAAIAPPPIRDATADKQRERERITAALAECAGNQTHAARHLGISRSTLIARIIEHGIARPRKT